MRRFFHKLATKLKAPRWVRARLLPEGQTTSLAEFEVSDIATEFYRELGLQRELQKRGVVRRFLSAMWKWEGTNNAFILALASAPFFFFVFPLALLVLAFAFFFSFAISEGEELNRIFFSIFFGGMTLLWLVSFFFPISLAWLSVSVLSLAWILGGIC